MIATLDNKKCIGCGMCVGISDEIFSINYDINKASVKKGVVLDSKKIDKAKEAVEMCPVQAIKVK